MSRIVQIVSAFNHTIARASTHRPGLAPRSPSLLVPRFRKGSAEAIQNRSAIHQWLLGVGSAWSDHSPTAPGSLMHMVRPSSKCSPVQFASGSTICDEHPAVRGTWSDHSSRERRCAGAIASSMSFGSCEWT